MTRALSRGEHDLEAMEVALRDAALGDGAKALGTIMTAAGRARRDEDVMCPKCDVAMDGTGPRDKCILTILGATPYTRARYECPLCKEALYPGDVVLGIKDTSRSPGVQRMAARMGAKEAFQEVATDLCELAGIALSAKDAERIAEGIGEDIERRDVAARRLIRAQEPPPCETLKTIPTLYIEFDGTGVPMVPHELEGRKGKQPDGSSKTREAKLGCVFTQTAVDDEGRPVRDPASTTFTGAIEDAATFGKRIYAEAVRRGLYHAKRVIVLGDGAEWVKNLAQTQFPMAIRIVDFYHAKEHVAQLCKALFQKQGLVDQQRERWWDLLAQGNIEGIIEEARGHLPRDPAANKDARREIEYLDKNKDQMRYASYREQGLFIGSGVIEAGCKNVIGKRLKQSGMKWTVRGANSIIALRCATLSQTRFTDYWDQRAA